MVDPKEILSLAGCMKQKAYIPKWMVRQFCPQAQLVTRIEPNMFSFEVMYDSVDKFFREHNNIHKVYIDETANLYKGGETPLMVDFSTFVIKCSFK